MAMGAEGKAGEASAATTAAATAAAATTTAATAAAATTAAVTVAAATPSQIEHLEESRGGNGNGLAADTMEAVKQLFERTQRFERTRERGLIHQRLTLKFHLPFSKWQVSCTNPWVLCTNFFLNYLT